jgi:hypothetical protein
VLAVIQQSHDEKIAMYLKLTKRELAEMLVTANDALGAMTTDQHPVYTYTPPPYTQPSYTPPPTVQPHNWPFFTTCGSTGNLQAWEHQ